MRKITADFIFPVATPPLENGVVILNDQGIVLAIEHASDFDAAELERYDGFIVPGFINTHCHLELSHMRGLLAESTGLIPFIKGVLDKRAATAEVIIQAIADCEREMIDYGIVAVGDISNVSDTFEQKVRKNLRYHTFVEVFHLNPAEATATFENGKDLHLKLTQMGLGGSIAPHAPYTVSKELFDLVTDYNRRHTNITSMHNQETVDENHFFLTKTGAFNEFYKEWGFDISFFAPTAKKSLASTLHHLEGTKQILLVHNTFSDGEDMQLAHSLKGSKVFWCSCPNANMYIENKLPNYDVFITNNCTMTIGTDSIASNWQLSILEEIKTIHKFFPHIDFNTLLRWGTLNGAQMLQFQDKLGSIEPGKQPGLNLLSSMDKEKMHVTGSTSVKKIM